MVTYAIHVCIYTDVKGLFVYGSICGDVHCSSIISATCFLVPDDHFPPRPQTLFPFTVIESIASSQREVDYHTLYELVNSHGSVERIYNVALHVQGEGIVLTL